jgi:hypothetical protein
MGKSKAGKSKGNVSNGIHRNVSRKITNAMRREYMASDDRLLNQMNALMKGKDVVMTIENPNKSETNRRFIRVKMNGKDFVNRMKNHSYMMKVAQE